MICLLKLFREGTPDDCGNKKLLIRDTLLEFLGTTLFVYCGIMSVAATGRQLAGNGLLEDVSRVFPIAFAFGVSILFMVYSIGHLSGGHMNPAVSLMMVFKRKLSWTKMACYWIAQFLGAMLAASLVWGCISGAQGAGLPNGGTVQRPPLDLGATKLDFIISTGNGFLCELMGSFIFYFVIAQTATDMRGVASSFFPAIPIGFSLVVVHIALIPFTGCGVNPARTFGPSMVVCMTGQCSDVVESSYWIYWIGPFLASLLVAEVTEWLAMECDDEKQGKAVAEEVGYAEKPQPEEEGELDA